MAQSTFCCDDCGRILHSKYRALHARSHCREEGNYVCDICGNRSERKRNLISHTIGVHYPSTVAKKRCDDCSYSTWQRKHLCRHIQSAHLRLESLYCDSCQAELTKHSLWHHHLGHLQNKAYWRCLPTCDDCGFRRNKKLAVQLHQKRHLPDRPQLDLPHCDNCGAVFAGKGTLSRHQEKHAPQGFTVYQCHSCRYRTSQLEYYIRHSMQQHRAEQMICDNCSHATNILHKSELQFHQRQHFPNFALQWQEKPAHICDDCGRQLPFKQGLATHVCRQVPPIPDLWFCDECGRKFNAKSDLGRHALGHYMALIGEDYTCDVCGYSSRNKSNLGCHAVQSRCFEIRTSWQRLSIADRCDDCFYSAWYPTNVQRHIYSVHMKAYRFCCDSCKVGFTAKGYLLRHQFRHVLAKTYLSCDGCGDHFNDRAILRRHQKRHVPSKPLAPSLTNCDDCGTSYARKQTLLLHQRKHRPGNSPAYHCDACTFAAKSLPHMADHWRRRHGFRWHRQRLACDACLKGFTFNNCMYLHWLRWHGSGHRVLRALASHYARNKIACDDCKARLRRLSFPLHYRKCHKGRCLAATYKCDNCQYHTLHRSPLIQHMLKVHNRARCDS